MVCFLIDFKDYSGFECFGMGIWLIVGIVLCFCDCFYMYISEIYVFLEEV